MKPSTTAILLFSRSAEREAEAKRFGAGAGGDLRIAQALINRTEATLATAGLPIVRVDETSQRGDTFGERLAAAMGDAFGLGYEHLLVVGNDAPRLSSRHLRHGAQLLENGQNLLLPDQRGGIALLGLSRQDFAPASFAQLPWETAALYSALGGHLTGAVVLPAVRDINLISDLRAAWFVLRARLSTLFTLLFTPPTYAPTRVVLKTRGPLSKPGRGPPVGW